MRIPTSNLSHNSLRSVLALGALTVAAAIAPASASAVAEVRVSTASNGTKTLRFSASDNERNAISVKFSSNEFEIREFGKGPQVNAGAGCTQVNTRTVRCARSGNFNIRLSLGRGNDIARLAVAGEDGSQNGHVPSLVFGGPGSDTLVGGAGDDTLEGGDVEDGSLDGGDSLNGRGGSDTLYGGPSGDSLVGGQGSDSVGYEATSSRNVVTIDGMRNDGADLNNDGFGEELDQVDTTVEQVRGGSGPDTMTAAATGSTLFGGPGNDVLIGRQDNDVLDGGRGRDDLRGGGEQDRLTNEGRTERLLLSNDDVANDGADANGDGTSEELDNVRADVENMTGGDGNDVLVGNGVRNFLNGFAGNDTIDGGGGEDVLDGERGSDRLLAGPGADTYNGDFPEGAVPTPDSDPPAPGIDTVDYGARTAPVRVMIGRPSGTTHDPDGQDANGDGVAEENDNVKRTIEVVIGGSANDILRAGEAGFGPPGGVVVGEPGNEGIPGAKLIGGPGTGSDTLIGDARADTLVGGLGPDDLRGGGSFDTASYKENTLPVLVSLDNVRNDGTDADGNGVAEEDDSVGLGGDVENIEGGSGNDLLVGNASRNILTGGLGADRLRGLAGPDFLRANDGVKDPEISCGDGNDSAEVDLKDGPMPADCNENGTLTPKGESHFIELSNKSVRANDDGGVKTRVSCPKKRRGGCEGEVALETVADKPIGLGETRYDLKAGDKTNVRVELSTRGRELLNRRGKLLITATARQRNSKGQPLTAFVRLDVLAPR